MSPGAASFGARRCGLERRVGLGHVNDLRVTQHDADECLAVSLEGSELERHRRAARLRPRGLAASSRHDCQHEPDEHWCSCHSCPPSSLSESARSRSSPNQGRHSP